MQKLPNNITLNLNEIYFPHILESNNNQKKIIEFKKNIELLKHNILSFSNKKTLEDIYIESVHISLKENFNLLETYQNDFLYSFLFFNNILKELKNNKNIDLENIPIKIETILEHFENLKALPCERLNRILKNIDLENIITKLKLNSLKNEATIKILQNFLFIQKADNNTTIILNKITLKNIYELELDNLILLYLNTLESHLSNK
jgi:hypothetical protein